MFKKGLQAILKSNQSNLLQKVNPISQALRLTFQNKYCLNHIQNMLDENRKYDVEQLANVPLIEKTDRIYKPTYTIEFNREGEVLLYSCDPIKESVVYFKYPYILYESFIPACLYMWFYNHLDLEWYFNNIFLYAATTLWIPRVWYWRNFNYMPTRIYLLRGGKVLKVESNSLAGDRFTNWVETFQIHPLTQDQRHFDDRDNADFLTEEGQLKYDLAVQLDHYQEMGVNSQDALLYFKKQGVVHHPELFEAALKGYNIDTSDFAINTAHNIRAREGNLNM